MDGVGGVGRTNWGVSVENDTDPYASIEIATIDANDIEFKTETRAIQNFKTQNNIEAQLIATKLKRTLTLTDDQLSDYLHKAKSRQLKSKHDLMQKIPQVSEKTFIRNKDDLALLKSVTTAVRQNQNLTGKVCEKILQKHKEDNNTLSTENMKISEEIEVKTEMAQMLSTMKQSQKLPTSTQAQKELKENVLPLDIIYLSWEIAEVIQECDNNLSKSLKAQYSDLLRAVQGIPNPTNLDRYLQQMTHVMNNLVNIEVIWMKQMLPDMPQLIHNQLTRHFKSIALDIKQEFESNVRNLFND